MGCLVLSRFTVKVEVREAKLFGLHDPVPKGWGEGMGLSAMGSLLAHLDTQTHFSGITDNGLGLPKTVLCGALVFDVIGARFGASIEQKLMVQKFWANVCSIVFTLNVQGSKSETPFSGTVVPQTSGTTIEEGIF